MSKKTTFLWSVLVIAAFYIGCAEEKDEEKLPLVFGSYVDHEPNSGGLVMKSSAACQLDSDCVGANFCYYGICTSSCDADTPCADGKVCSPKGRCLEPNAERDGSDDEQKSEAEELAFGVEFITKPSELVKVPMGTEDIYVNFRTTKTQGTVNYIVVSSESRAGIGDIEASKLLQAEPSVDENNGTAFYQFKIPCGDSSLGVEQGKSERVRLLTSVGEFYINLQPMRQASGYYEGQVSAYQLGGVSLPFRMAVDIKPIGNTKKPVSTFDEIGGITLYVPSSTTDLLSPDVPKEDGSVTWSKIEMIKETNPNNCNSKIACWSANYSTNNYSAPNSQLIREDQKINRAIRIEIDDLDLERGAIHGYARDIMSGLYRKTDSTGKDIWGQSFMEGRLVMMAQGDFDPTQNTILDHVSVDEELRDINNAVESDPAYVCTDQSLGQLMALACPEGDTSCECAGITSIAAYEASGELGSNCVLAASEAILADENIVSKVVSGLLERDSTDVEPVGKFTTLNEFLQDCVSGNADSICVDRPELDCAVDLLGRMLITQQDVDVQTLGNWHQILRESYLGSQFAAWRLDVDIRKKWLDGGEVPQFLASALSGMNQNLLAEWEQSVLQSHLKVIHKQFTQTALEVLTRVNLSAEAMASRDVILGEFAQGWEGLGSTIALGLKRYNALLENTIDRQNKAAEMQGYLLDMYYVGLIESSINLETENSSLNGTYSKNLYENVSNIRMLDQSFDDLIFMRDAEVVVSTSLDPASSNQSVLAERKNLAEKTLSQALTYRTEVYDKNEAKEINQASISATLSNHLDSLMGEIVSLCGYPNENCSDATQEGCAPQVGSNICGFLTTKDDNGNYSKGSLERDVNSLNISGQIVVDKRSSTSSGENNSDKTTGDSGVTADDSQYATDILSDVNRSEAANAILAYREAIVDYEIAIADYTATLNKANLALTTCNSYYDNIQLWHKNRQDLLDKVKSNVEIINQHYNNITQAEKEKLEAELTALRKSYAAQQTALNNWMVLSESHVQGSADRIYTIEDLAQTQAIFNFTGEAALHASDAAASFFEAADSAFDYKLAGIAGIINSAGALAWTVASGVSMGAEIAQISQEAKLEVKTLEYEYNEELADRKVDLAVTERELALAEAMALYDSTGCKSDKSDKTCRTVVKCSCGADYLDDFIGIDTCPTGCTTTKQEIDMGLEQWILHEQNAIDILDEVNDTMRELFEISDVYERDLQDLDFKRQEARGMLEDLGVKSGQVEKAALKMVQAMARYYSVVQRAMTLESQYRASQERLNQLKNLYSTPASIFSYASDLEIVENKIELAKERIYDYIAAVEYLAIRPFVDLRRATYLARSPKDLDAIIDQIDTVVSKCGGNTTTNKITLSVREQLGITTDFKDMTKGDRFRLVMKNSNIPISSLTRYTVDTTVRDLMNSGRELRSGTFALNISDYANLAATCNARIESIAIQLVGENLMKEGEHVVPTMTLFYDGQTQLASCQPNIEALVETLGAKTSYGKYSTFIVTPTKISPTAGINVFGEANKHLAGNPLSTTYTILIDTEIGENAKIDWDKLEDIKLELTYTYQDLFASTSECSNF